MSRPDVVVVGGGIQGATMAWAAARKGLKPLLVERGALASGATGSSLGILHGGLRYLQTLDVPRWRRSRRAQAWFARHFPQHVRRLTCVMPLYAGRLRSAPLFRLAGLADRMLARALEPEAATTSLRLLTAEETIRSYPVPRQALVAAAQWDELAIGDEPALVAAILVDAGLAGAAVRCGVAARELRLQAGRTIGVRVREADGAVADIETGAVINCTGAWAGGWTGLPAPSCAVLAFNVLLDLQLPTEHALAVSETPGHGRSYFLRPVGSGTLVGTWHCACPGMVEPSAPEEEVARFLAVLDRAAPELGIARAPVLQVLAGLLPDADGRGRALSSRDRVLAGPRGYRTVVGPKLTTAPLLSMRVVDEMWPDRAGGA
jgi:glycerol-3-phosphate dehydrogenase